MRTSSASPGSAAMAAALAPIATRTSPKLMITNKECRSAKCTGSIDHSAFERPPSRALSTKRPAAAIHIARRVESEKSAPISNTVGAITAAGA